MNPVRNFYKYSFLLSNRAEGGCAVASYLKLASAEFLTG